MKKVGGHIALTAAALFFLSLSFPCLLKLPPLQLLLQLLTIKLLNMTQRIGITAIRIYLRTMTLVT